MFPDDAPLLPSGFRVIPLESKTVKYGWIFFLSIGPHWTRVSFVKHVAYKVNISQLHFTVLA